MELAFYSHSMKEVDQDSAQFVPTKRCVKNIIQGSVFKLLKFISSILLVYMCLLLKGRKVVFYLYKCFLLLSLSLIEMGIIATFLVLRTIFNFMRIERQTAPPNSIYNSNNLLRLRALHVLFWSGREISIMGSQFDNETSILMPLENIDLKNEFNLDVIFEQNLSVCRYSSSSEVASIAPLNVTDDVELKVPQESPKSYFSRSIFSTHRKKMDTPDSGISQNPIVPDHEMDVKHAAFGLFGQKLQSLRKREKS